MSEFPPLFFAVIRRIDRFTEATGKLISLLMLFLVGSISYECFSRYLFAARAGGERRAARRSPPTRAPGMPTRK